MLAPTITSTICNKRRTTYLPTDPLLQADRVQGGVLEEVQLDAGPLLRVEDPVDRAVVGWDGAEVGGWRFTPDGRVMGPALYVMSGTPRTIRFDPGTGELLP